MNRRSHKKKPLLRFADLAEMEARKEEARRVTYRDLMDLSKGPEHFGRSSGSNKADVVNTANIDVNNEPEIVNNEGVNVNTNANTASIRSTVSTASTTGQQRLKSEPTDRSSRHLIGVRIPLDLLEKLDFWCDQKRVAKQTAVEFALRELVDGRVQFVNTASQASSALSMIMINDAEGKGIDYSGIDPKIFSIINHYEQITQNKAKPADLELAKTLCDHPPLAVECGILLAQLRPKPGKINSLRYCVSVVDEVVANYGGQLNAYAEYLRRKLDAQKRTKGKAV